MNKKYIFRLILVILVLFTTSCVTSRSGKRSGFLVKYSGLKPDPGTSDVYFYRNPEYRPEDIVEQYRAFMIDPVVVYFHRDAIGRAMKPDDIKYLTDYFQRELAIALNKQYFVVDTPGPNVARFRIAITGVAASNFRLTIHPTLAAVDLEKAAMEIEMIDSKTAGRIAALMDLRPRSGYTKFDDLTIKKHSEAVIDAWIAEVLKRLDSVYKVPAPPSDSTSKPPSDPEIKNEGTDQSS